jgi:small subunit ribosomal protein S1
MIPSRISELKENIGEELTGNVTGSAKYGVFVEFNECLTGMIHVNDLTPEMLKAHKAREIKPGVSISFKIKEVVSDTKIILTQLDQAPSVDLWDGIEDRIKTPSEVIGTVRAVKDYGIFIDIEKGVAGLLHISEIEDVLETTDIKPGDSITVQVTRIDAATRKIFLKI